MQKKVASNLASQIAKIRAHTKLPIAVGFGISTPHQAATVASVADAVVVGSAVVNRIASAAQSPDLIPSTVKFVQTIGKSIKLPPGA
jgi:tryptophan synthase alpha chain